MSSLAACAADRPDDYAQQNRTAFLASCAAPLEDTLLQIELCQCVFEESQNEIAFDRFVEIESAFKLDPDSPLPEELVDIIAGCVITTADL